MPGEREPTSQATALVAGAAEKGKRRGHRIIVAAAVRRVRPGQPGEKRSCAAAGVRARGGEIAGRRPNQGLSGRERTVSSRFGRLRGGRPSLPPGDPLETLLED